VAVVNDTLLTGKAVLFLDRTGTLELESDTEPMLKCVGQLRYTASQTGVAGLRCNDGTESQIPFTAISETKGYGNGRTAKGTAGFTFGFDMAAASAYLKLPVAKAPAPPATAPSQPQ
jgi:hypothetical protein